MRQRWWHWTNRRRCVAWPEDIRNRRSRGGRAVQWSPCDRTFTSTTEICRWPSVTSSWSTWVRMCAKRTQVMVEGFPIRSLSRPSVQCTRTWRRRNPSWSTWLMLRPVRPHDDHRSVFRTGLHRFRHVSFPSHPSERWVRRGWLVVVVDFLWLVENSFWRSWFVVVIWNYFIPDLLKFPKCLSNSLINRCKIFEIDINFQFQQFL